jgi:chromosome segregation ATPase
LAKKTKASELDAEHRHLKIEISQLEEHLTECEKNFDNEVNARLKYLNDQVAHLSQRLSQKDAHLQHEAEARADLARKAAQLEEELNECIKHSESEANAKVEMRNKILTLEQQLAVQASKAHDSLPHDVEALRAHLQSHQSQVVTMRTSLANAEAVEQQLRDQFLQKDTDMQKLVDENTELTSENITITLEHESLKVAHNEMSRRLKNALETLQEKHDLINCLEIDQFEIFFDRDQARDALENANQLLAETKATEARHQQTIQDIRSAYDLTLKHERGRVESLQGEVADFQNKVGMAMRDAQRSQE